MKWVLLLLCLTVFAKDCSSLNVNFGLNDVFEIFGYTAADDTEVLDDPAELEDDDPPPHEQVAKMARYITHKSNWGALATLAAREPIVGFPFVNIFSLSDGPVGESSGVPYMYISPWEISARDLTKNNKTSITMSLAQGNFCAKKNYDPEDPRCAHVILTGIFVKLARDSEEAKFAENALFSRHPIMPDWPEGHHWFFAKLDIQNIIILDFFGGAITVPVEEYFNANPLSP